MLATTFGNKLQLDMEDIELGDIRRCFRGMIARYPAGSETKVFERYLLHSGGHATMAAEGSATYYFPLSDGQFTIAPAKAFGVDADTALAASWEVAAIETAIDNEGWDSKLTSITGLCSKVMKETSVECRQTPTRWRRLSHGAIHQGPMMVCKGGGEDVAEYDRVAAFLNAMKEPCPVVGSHKPIMYRKWERVRRMNGIVRAIVYVDPAVWIGKVPPLPVKVGGVSILATGTLHGVWTIPLLVAAEECGAVVLEVLEGVSFDVDTVHAPAAERIERIADKGLRKAVYTRYWGRFASKGGWKGTVFCPKGRGVHKLRGSDLYWTYSGIDVDKDWQVPKRYMPDHAAYIASRNHAEMSRVLAGIPSGEVVATCIDAVWTKPSEVPTGFKEKTRGVCRYYGIGTYTHDDKWACMGVEGSFVSFDSIEGYGRKIVDRSRVWRGDVLPALSVDAESDPMEVTMGETEEDRATEWQHATVYDAKWTAKGWIAGGEE